LIGKGLKSKNKKGYWVSYVLGILLFGFIAVYASKQETSNSQPNYIFPALTVLFFLAAVICLYRFIIIKNYSIVNNRLTVTSFGKPEKSYHRDEIESWTEIEVKGKSGRWNVLTLHIKTGEKLKISSSIYENYSEIKQLATNTKSRNLKYEQSSEHKNGFYVAVFMMIVGLLFFIGVYNALYRKNINTEDIAVFGDETLNIQYIEAKHDYILIRVKSYPDFNFRISGKDLKAVFVDDLFRDIKTGDSIFIGIDKAEYRIKLAKTDSLTFFDKFYFNTNINVQTLQSKKNYYLQLSEINALRSESKSWDALLFGAFGSVLLLGGIFGIRKSIQYNYEQDDIVGSKNSDR